MEVGPLAKRDYSTAPINKRFGRWTVIGYSHALIQKSGRKHYWLCRCDCGTERSVCTGGLVNGTSRSCRCAIRERVTLHGMSRTPTYNSWAQIMRRCVWDTNLEGYSARGITVCEYWRVFLNFLADMGERPKNRTIDRVDNDGHYSCGHCQQCVENGWPKNARWATHEEQGNNKRTNRFITWDGKTLTITQWERELGMSHRFLYARLERGWSVKKAMTTPKIMENSHIRRLR